METAQQTLNYAGPVIARGPGWTTRDAGTVTLSGRDFTVEVQTFDDPIHSTQVRLTGVRGGVFFLRGYLGPDSGKRQVISCKSGQPLRVKGAEVRIILLGDVIEPWYLR